MDRKTFLKSIAVGGAALPCCSSLAGAESGKCADAACASDAKAVRDFLSAFLQKEERGLNREALVKLMEERGRACCRALDFRQKLIQDSAGSVDKLVELMEKIVGEANCKREGEKVTLIYPMGKCVCGWSPTREPSPDDPYCDCSKANNRTLFETVSGKAVKVELAESPRRGGKVCRFLIHLG